MYQASTLPREAGSTCSLIQLSSTMYRLIRASPTMKRNSSQNGSQVLKSWARVAATASAQASA
ncbi:hypothetical protein D3C76_1475170 [compost metagenome]